jgi:phytoene dehydrogenase-like protein
MYDAVVVGSGPNGLTAAVTLAESGLRVLVLEAHRAPGGGARTEELTLPGVRHDVCSAVHPFGAASPAFAAMELHEHGLRWAHSPVQLAHPLDGGRAAVLTMDLDETCEHLGADGPAWRGIVGWAVRNWDEVVDIAMSPPLHAFRHPIQAPRLAWKALRSATRLVRRFHTTAGRALVAGLAAHSAVPLTTLATAGAVVTLGAAAHTVGWPIAVGGSGSLTDALLARLRELGGEVRTETLVERWPDIPQARIVLLDTGPEAALRIAGERMSPWTRRRYRSIRRSPGVFKVDIALDGPIPWENEDCRRSATLHLGGSYEEIAEAERRVSVGEATAAPFIIAAQPVVADPTRAPEGTHVLWAYTRVPRGTRADMTEPILGQVERFAPGFRSLIRSISSKSPDDLERENPSLVGGDITAGAISLRGILARPKLFRPYRIGTGVYLCSASASPSAGVHGMSGWHAARAALKG